MCRNPCGGLVRLSCCIVQIVSVDVCILGRIPDLFQFSCCTRVRKRGVFCSHVLVLFCTSRRTWICLYKNPLAFVDDRFVFSHFCLLTRVTRKFERFYSFQLSLKSWKCLGLLEVYNSGHDIVRHLWETWLFASIIRSLPLLVSIGFTLKSFEGHARGLVV